MTQRSKAIKKLQEITGLSKQWLSDLLTIADFPEEAKEQIRKGKIGRRGGPLADLIELIEECESADIRVT